MKKEPTFSHQPAASLVGLYTILTLPILYGVWHTKGWTGGAVVYCATVVQQYSKSMGNAGRWAGAING